MNYAIEILEDKLKWHIQQRDSFRNSAKKKDKGLNEFFSRWGKEQTLIIKSLKKAINTLKQEEK